jgi:hypothetical protein
MGGAAALQSELDARVASHFSEAVSQVYTQAGKPKAGCNLDQAERAVALAKEELDRATDRVQKLDSAARDLESASKALLATSASLGVLERDLELTDAKTRQLAELRQKEAEQSHATKEASGRYDAAVSADRQIRRVRADISKLEERLKPQNETASRLEKARDETKGTAAFAEKAYRNATEAARTARLRHELARSYTLLFEKTEAHSKLAEKNKKVADRRRNLVGLNEQLAKLPKIERARLQKLHKLEAGCSNARAALQAMATGLEVVAANKPVKAGSRAIKAGEKLILTEDTDVAIGPSVRLRIQPGGGTSLADARQAEADARKVVQEVLDSLGLNSVQEATEVLVRRDKLGSQIEAAQAELAGMGAESLAEELQSAQNEVAADKANAERLAGLAPDVKAPGDKAAAKALVRTLEKGLSDADGLEAEAKVRRDRSANALESAETTLTERRADSEQQSNELTGLKAQLELLLLSHSDDAARAEALIECQSAKISTEARLKSTIDAIAALQPDLLERDRMRIARAIKERANERNDARTQIAVAQAALRSDGSDDPQEALAIAQAKARSAIENLKSVRRKAEAVALLNRLFLDEQRTLAEQFTQPLADRISGYLQCIFSAGARAQVNLVNNEFSGLRLFRPGFGGAPFAFDTLSGGAKEQTAAAVRLAMAEVLAANHDGCLPVIFDDAFAFSDPERVNQLQRMLDLAATRGLQIIVLTCNPMDYAALGARQVILRQESPTFADEPVMAVASSLATRREQSDGRAAAAPPVTKS